MVADWLFAPTDNVNLIIEVAVGLLATAYVAGWWSIRKNKAWLNSPDALPYFKKLAAAIRAELPAYPELPTVPTVAEIVAEIPPYPDVTDKLALLEERMGTKLSAQMEAKWGTLQEELSKRVSQVVQANLASARSQFKAAVENGDEEGELGIMGEVLGAIGMDSESIQKLGRVKRLYNRAKQAGGGKFDLNALLRGGGGNNGGASSQPGLPPVGTVQPDAQGRRWVFTGQPNSTGGWALIDQSPPQYQPPAALPTPTMAAPTAGPAAPPVDEMPPPLPPEKPK